MSKKNVFLFLLCLLIIPVVSGFYTVTETITTNEYTDTKTIIENQEYVYSISPDNYRLVTITLEGSETYLPRLYLFDPESEKFIQQIEKLPGETITHTFTGDIIKGEPKEYYLIINGYGDGGETFTMTYEAVKQDDAETGDDATNRFRNAEILSDGDYQGHLGGGDEIDYYALKLEAEEKVEFTLATTGKGHLGFTLIDGNLNTRIDKGAMLENSELTTSYTSLREQTVWIGIAGSTPYTLNIGGREEVDTTHQQDQVSVTDETKEPTITLVEEEQEEQAMNEEEQEVETTTTNEEGTEEDNKLGILIGVAALLLILLALSYFLGMRHKGKAAEEAIAKEKKTTKKKK